MGIRCFGLTVVVVSLLDAIGTIVTLLNFLQWDQSLMSRFSLQCATFFTFSSCLFDLLIISCIRICIQIGLGLAFSLAPYRTRRNSIVVKRLKYPVGVLSMLTYLYLLLKVLIVSENAVEQLQQWEYIFMIVYQFVMTCIVCLALVLYSKHVVLKGSYYNVQHTVSDGLLLNGEASNKKKKQDKGDISNVWRLITWSFPDWPIILVAFCALLVASVSDIFVPFYIGDVIGNIVVHRDYSSFINSIIQTAVITATSALATGLRGSMFMWSCGRLAYRIRRAVCRSVLRQDIPFFSEQSPGELLSRISADVQTMTDTVGVNINIFLRNCVQILGMCGVMFSVSWRMSLFNFAFLPLLLIGAISFGSLYEKIQKLYQTSLARASKVVEETVNVMPTVFSCAGERYDLYRYEQRLSKVLKLDKWRAVLQATSVWSERLLGSGLLVGTMWYGGHLVIDTGVDGKPLLAADKLVTFLLYQLSMQSATAEIGDIFQQLMLAVGASAKIFEYIDRQPRFDKCIDAIPSTNRCDDPGDIAGGHVVFKNVCFTYPKSTRKVIGVNEVETEVVLSNVSFEVMPGECVALVGASGSGKSTCVSLLQNFYEPDSGDILIDGKSVREYSHDELHKHMLALVGQEPVLFSRSIRSNIEYALPIHAYDGDDVDRDDEDDADDSHNPSEGRGGGGSEYWPDGGLPKECVVPSDIGNHVRVCAKLSHVPEFVDRLVDGLKTECGSRGAQLSGGQKQRVALARAFAVNPHVLVLDEATSALDAHSERLVQEALAQWHRSVLVIAHRLSTVRNADRIIVLNSGEVAEVGSHKELIERGGVYADLVKRQMDCVDDVTGNSTPKTTGLPVGGKSGGSSVMFGSLHSQLDTSLLGLSINRSGSRRSSPGSRNSPC